MNTPRSTVKRGGVLKVVKATELTVYAEDTRRGLLRVSLPVELTRDQWTLTSGSPERLVVVRSKESPRRFNLVFTLKGTATRAEAIVVGPFGEVERSVLQLDFPPFWRYLRSTAEFEPSVRDKQFFNVGLGYTTLLYRQARRPDFKQQALTAKLGTTFFLFPRWDAGVSAYVTALPLSTSAPGVSARFLGLNGRVGYELGAAEPWKIGLQGGVYYATMFVNGAAFGFQSLMGPQVYPTFRRAFGVSSVSAYLKYSPIGDGFSVLSIVNREVAFGLGWTRKLRSGGAVSLSFDLADLRFSVGTASVSSTSATIGAGYAF